MGDENPILVYDPEYFLHNLKFLNQKNKLNYPIVKILHFTSTPFRVYFDQKDLFTKNNLDTLTIVNTFDLPLKSEKFLHFGFF